MAAHDAGMAPASRRRRSTRGAKAPRDTAPSLFGPRRAPVRTPVPPCALCGRQARGFGYCHGLRWERHPFYRFCSMACLTAGSALARTNNGMIDKTDMETAAIRDARRALAEVLTDLGLLAPFHDRTPEDIDRIIEACVDGFQASMLRQSNTGDVPW